MNHKFSVWGHTLFKNEERWLWYSVTSVIDYVDRLLLWDTGSTDNSWEIAKILKQKYPKKVDLKQYGKVSVETFYKARQEMLDNTKADWFLVVDADEVWWDESIKKLIYEIKNADKKVESLVVPTVNLIGDIYHFQENKAGNYKFGKLKGHYNLRAIKTKIPGLCSKGKHGVWGWADESGKQIQDRKSFKFVDVPYLHASFVPRAGENKEKDVPKRKKKLKYEIGENFPLDYYYPESLFKPRPEIVPSPWRVMNNKYLFRAFLETPLRKVKRRVIKPNVGY